MFIFAICFQDLGSLDLGSRARVLGGGSLGSKVLAPPPKSSVAAVPFVLGLRSLDPPDPPASPFPASLGPGRPGAREPGSLRKSAPRAPQGHPKSPPRADQERPRAAQERPTEAKSGPRTPKSGPRAAKSAPRAPKRSQERPKSAKEQPIWQIKHKTCKPKA